VNCKVTISSMIALLSIAHFAGATLHLGTVGETYPVIESDVVAELRQEAAKLAAKNKLPVSRQMKTYQPANLHPLPRATANRSFAVDMSYTLNQDLLDGQDRVLYGKGYTFNPLDYIAFPGGLVVIDGADPVQIEWFKKTPYAGNHRAKLLLSNGSAFELTEKLKRPVFYLTNDIAERLRLTAVPSIVVQKEDKMLVQEIVLPRDKQGGDYAKE
jgi:conjugal transfer pilus assembly protein TraW